MKFCPDNSQYIRYVQEIQQIEDKLLTSPLSPKNKLMSEKQAFGSTSGLSGFQGKRDTTLGYFSVPPPFEKGEECERQTRLSGQVSGSPTLKAEEKSIFNRATPR